MSRKRPTYRRSSIRQPGKGKMPRWIWREPKKDLPLLCKKLSHFFWRFGPEGCDWWNCMLAKWFKVTPRRIQQALNILKFYPLIAIAYPDGRGRVIRRLPYGTKAHFQVQKPVWLERHPPWTGPETTPQGVKKISPLDNAQQEKRDTTLSSLPATDSPKPDCPPSPAEPASPEEYSKTTQGEQIPLEPSGNQDGRSAAAVREDKPEFRHLIGELINQPRFKQLFAQTGKANLARALFELEEDLGWTKFKIYPDPEWTNNEHQFDYSIEDNLLTIGEALPDSVW